MTQPLPRRSIDLPDEEREVDNDVAVKELIQRISEDLLESEQERTTGGRRAVFEVAELTIELSFVVSRSREGHGGIDLKVVNVGGQADRADERTQRMTLRLVGAGHTGGN